MGRLPPPVTSAPTSTTCRPKVILPPTKKNILTGKFCGQRATLSLDGLPLEKTKPIVRLGSEKQLCLGFFLGVVKFMLCETKKHKSDFLPISGRQKNSERNRTSKNVECGNTKNIPLLHQPIQALKEVLLNPKAPKLYLSLQK